MRKVEYAYLTSQKTNEGIAFFLSDYFIDYSLLDSLNKVGKEGWEVAFRKDSSVVVMQRIIEEEEE